MSTTLIENGVDLPNANTLIVLDADKLGLSQLYQLKGRVGRGNRDSYAYFVYSNNLSDIAYKRLKAISEFTAMGSGFKIAMRDMELRGAGNLFGSQQHGHLLKIGYAMYMNILNNTIEEIKTNKINNKLYQEIKIETDLPTAIPQNSNFTTNQKMLLYSKIAEVRSDIDFNNIVEQLSEIYGEVPVALLNLCKLSFVKNLLYRYNAKRLVIKSQKSFIEFNNDIDIASINELICDYTQLDISNNKVILVINVAKQKCVDFLLNMLNRV